MTVNVTRAEACAIRLQEAILSGDYLSGERLIEVKIAQSFDVSQNTIRDALRILEREGWVVKHPRHGVYVRALSATDAAEIGALITAVETLALRWVIEHLDKSTRTDLNGLIAGARKFADKGEPRQSVEQMLRFHQRIGAAAPMPLTEQFLDTLYNQVRLLEGLRQARVPRSLAELDARIAGHERLMGLISEGEADAACAHLREQIAAYSADLTAILV